MTVIGYKKARALMRQLDWKMLATVHGDSIDEIVLYHPKQENRYKVRIDSGVKLWRECREIKQIDHCTRLLCYDWAGSDETLI